MKKVPDACRGWVWTRCGLADLSLTPLLPVPWPLQLWEDRGVVIVGSSGTKAGTHIVTSSHAYVELILHSSKEAAVRELMTRTVVPMPYHTCRAIPTLNLLSSPFIKTVITLGFSCWLSQNPLSRVRRATQWWAVTLTYTCGMHECTHTYRLKIGVPTEQLIVILWQFFFFPAGLKWAI